MHYTRSYHNSSIKYKPLEGKTIKQLLCYLAPYRFYLGLAIALLVISKGIEAFVPLFLGKVLQTVLNSISFSPKQANDTLLLVLNQCLTASILLVCGYALEISNVVLKNWIGQKGILHLRVDVYRHIQAMPLEFYNTQPVGTLMTRTIHDVEQINQMFCESIVPLIGSAILFFFICFGVITLDLRAAIVLFCTLPFAAWLLNHFRFHQRRCYDLIRSIVAALNAFIQEQLMGAATIRAFGLHRAEKRQFNAINCDHRNANIETIHYFSFFFAGIDLLQGFSLIILFVVLAVFSAPMTGFEAGTFFSFSLYILMLFRPLLDLAERYNLLQSAIAAANRIFHLLDQPTEAITDTGHAELNTIETIDFEDVWFAYKDDHWVLKGATFSIKKGEVFALVGATGSGKTTLVNLLLRLIKHQKGEIKINGKNIQDYSLYQLRRQFSVILQDPELFSGTIEENISLGKEEVSRETVESVVDEVGLRPLINSFSDGVQHTLAERGKSLSAGQRQLISLARAIAQKGSMLILDEATANIDSMTENLIQDILKKIFSEKTAIVIAHRLSTIRNVDKILVIHEGRVKEQGTHKALFAQKGIYEKLYRLQFKTRTE